MARPHPALITLARDGTLGPFQDEGELLASAIEHRMDGLLWSSLQDRGGIGSRSWRMRVASNDLVNRRRNEANWEGLRQAADTATSIGIELATVKGVSAEARWYDRPGDRPSGDVDLIVGPADIARVAELVRLMQPDHPLLSELGPLVKSRLLQSVELRDVNGIAIDLHFDLLKLGVPCREPEALWEHMAVYEDEPAVLVPSGELALLHLLLHLTKDRFRTLLGYVDVQRIIQRTTIDWTLLDELARTQGLETHVGLALGAVDEVLPIEPGPMAGAVSGARLAWRYLWRPEIRLRGNEGVTRFRHRQELLPFLAHGRRREALRFWIRRTALPPHVLIRDATRGPYWWRVTGGRLGAAWRRRRDARRPR